MIAFRCQKKVGPRQDWSHLGAYFKISDEHPHSFHMRSPPRIISSNVYHKICQTARIKWLIMSDTLRALLSP